MILYIKLIFAYLRYFPLFIAFYCSSRKEIIKEDIFFWISQGNLNLKSDTLNLTYLLFMNPCFRNLFYFRCPKFPNLLKKICCPPDNTFYLASHSAGSFNQICGGGIYIIHGFGTRIRAKKIGKGCKFRQLTTIGTKAENLPFSVPTIGNNVEFGTNVIVCGDITIGDNVTIGAGSVVTKNVPSNTIVAGNPAKIIRWKNEI